MYNKYATMGPVIPKEIKYKLHYGDVVNKFENLEFEVTRHVKRTLSA